MATDVVKEFKINLNQNIWLLIVSFTALGFAEFFDFSSCYWLVAFVLTIGAALSALISLSAYTINYWKKKLGRFNSD